jgi:lambda family phage portal protein
VALMAKKLVRPLSYRIASFVNDLIMPVAPGAARRREQALQHRLVLQSMSGGGHYNGAGRTARGKDFRANSTDAVESMRADRARMGWIAQDMLRNNPRVVKARRQIVNNVVGAGIMPSVRMADPLDVIGKIKIEDLLRRYCFSREMDADGKLSLFGLQQLAFSTIVGGGEVLLRRRVRDSREGLVLPFQVQIMECDYLNETIDGPLPGGNTAVQGIEFNQTGKRLAYHLYAEHPGARFGTGGATRRVAAENVIHAFDVLRPGQQRGMTWLAPVITLLHELQKYQDGQVKRQEIASLFAAIYTSEDTGEEIKEEMGELTSGAIMTIGSDEKMEFTDPPTVEGYEPFMRVTDRTIAAGLGLTYEGFTGDYSNVNYSSGRMGRLDVDPNYLHWQKNLAIAQICDPIGGWLKEAMADAHGIDPGTWVLDWTAPRRPVLDPTKDWPAYEDARRAGFMSRRQIIRETGGDPDKVEAEIIEENAWAATNKVVLSSDAATPKSASPAKPEEPEKKGTKT